MDTDITLELPVQPPSDNTRFLAEDISNPQVPILEDQLDVLFRAEQHQLQQKFTHLCSTWMGHDLSDEEKWEMEVHGFEEAERSLCQIADLDTFYDPFAAIGLQRFAAQPRYLAQQSVMDMIFMNMSCRIDTAIWHLVQLLTMAKWPANWYHNLCIDMSTLDCLIPIAVTQNCYRLPFPMSGADVRYLLARYGITAAVDSAPAGRWRVCASVVVDSCIELCKRLVRFVLR
ncbi:hypothetical protein BKA82DRAFT_33803 [Pisolithus tinctorius]|uniref:Uncharacterized protein n=1 Tax=Pisolithus tinctorius Marx 270 TaxID=870435 RepID=A0A0C3JE06_PISTI|nr:hypothetical protein BKA82DRAFT_33803 [Pisolithus tinctorius]KIN95841.1 hypothetical protein M404DRAFT_33803 [Pisolithus tinctorius Marx 270]